jgi:hypothetical protein
MVERFLCGRFTEGNWQAEEDPYVHLSVTLGNTLRNRVQHGGKFIQEPEVVIVLTDFEYQDHDVLECDAVYFDRWLRKFRSFLLHHSSG